MGRAYIPMGTVKDDFEPLPLDATVLVQRHINHAIQSFAANVIEAFRNMEETFARSAALIALGWMKSVREARRRQHYERSIRAAIAYHARHDRRRTKRKARTAHV